MHRTGILALLMLLGITLKSVGEMVRVPLGRVFCFELLDCSISNVETGWPVESHSCSRCVRAPTTSRSGSSVLPTPAEAVPLASAGVIDRASHLRREAEMACAVHYRDV